MTARRQLDSQRPVSLEKRRLKITELVSRRPIHTQADLERALFEAGIAVTQATISRDIQALGLRKQASADGRERYVLPKRRDGTLPHATRQIQRLTVEVAVSMNLVVLTCLPASADVVAEAVEQLAPAGLIGTFAHGRRVLVVARDVASAAEIGEQLRAHSR